MLDVRKQVALRYAVASQFVGHDHSRHILQTFQQAPEESLGGRGIAAFLNTLLVTRPRPAPAKIVRKLAPDFWHHRRMLSYDTIPPRSAKISLTSRKLRLNTRYSQTAWLGSSTGKR